MHSKLLRARRRVGFTLIELMVIVMIIGLMLAIAVPAYKKLTERSTNTLMSNELRVASGALEHYALENGSWPPDGGGGWPTELTGYLPPPDRWSKPTPLGGTWSWALHADDIVASLRISDFTVPASQVLKLDGMIDDGNVGTGRLFVSGSALVYTLEK